MKIVFDKLRVVVRGVRPAMIERSNFLPYETFRVTSPAFDESLLLPNAVDEHFATLDAALDFCRCLVSRLDGGVGLPYFNCRVISFVGLRLAVVNDTSGKLLGHLDIFYTSESADDFFLSDCIRVTVYDINAREWFHSFSAALSFITQLFKDPLTVNIDTEAGKD